MCEFPSWFEKDGEVRFLTDGDVEALIEGGFIEEWSDAVGHDAIRKLYGDAVDGWKERELFPCPPAIAAKIRQGKMSRMMKAAGLVAVYVNPDGQLHRDDGPATEYANGYKAWYQNGQLHRDDGPAEERANGSKEWYQNGQLHRADGPAEELADGSKYWYKNGLLHRDDGPAKEWVNGSKFWYQNGQLHRDDGPAEEWADGSKYWYKNGQLHRDDGPAVEWANGSKGWWVNDFAMTEEGYNRWREKEKSK